ncbi:uncharacterized protein [Rutidosis leptorrhynchoides]|uniref:uncharacterized protein n=1 Tax=Rutidosis leptorrhynchoides TaxID=125765 RepID=UPI003A9A6117
MSKHPTQPNSSPGQDFMNALFNNSMAMSPANSSSAHQGSSSSPASQPPLQQHYYPQGPPFQQPYYPQTSFQQPFHQPYYSQPPFPQTPYQQMCYPQRPMNETQYVEVETPPNEANIYPNSETENVDEVIPETQQESSRIKNKGKEKVVEKKSRISQRGITRTPWSAYEEKVLAERWVDATQNPIIGNSQTSASFWKAIPSDTEYDSDFEMLNDVVALNPQTLYLNLVSLEDSDDEEEEAESSIRPKISRRHLNRDRKETAQRLWNDYFSESPVFPGDYFRNRYRMSRALFLRICNGILSYSQEPLPKYFHFFHQRHDATGKPGFNIYQKCTSAIRQLAYGCAPDLFDEYLHMGQQTSYDCLDNFCKCVFHLLSHEYLRKPNYYDIQRLYHAHAQLHGFSGMLGSIDCMHWAWKNCPIAWKGQYTRGDHGHCPTIMLEAVASYDLCDVTLWIWHAYFGPAGSNNDINVLNQSDLFNELLEDTAPIAPFIVNGVTYNKGYYLADGIYPEWATLVKSFKCPVEPKNVKFKKFQEAARKDVERAFGVLQGRWAILKNPARPYSVNKIRRIMYTCVILHNMITEDNGRNLCNLEEDYLGNGRNRPQRSWRERVETRERMAKELRDRVVHHSLRNDLIEHIWTLPNNLRARNA